MQWFRASECYLEDHMLKPDIRPTHFLRRPGNPAPSPMHNLIVVMQTWAQAFYLWCFVLTLAITTVLSLSFLLTVSLHFSVQKMSCCFFFLFVVNSSFLFLYVWKERRKKTQKLDAFPSRASSAKRKRPVSVLCFPSLFFRTL